MTALASPKRIQLVGLFTVHKIKRVHIMGKTQCILFVEGAAASSLGSAVGCSVEGRAIDTALGQCFIPNSSH